MFRSRSTRSLAPLALLTFALMSCGAPRSALLPAPQAPAASGPTTPQIVTVSVRPGTSEADLLSRYPSAQLLALHSDEGYAQLLMDVGTQDSPPLDTLSINAQAVQVTGGEPNIPLVAGEAAVNAQGNSAWAGGNSAWAGGNSAWAGGTSGGSGPFTTFAENLPLWNLINLSAGQKLAPALGRGIKVAVIDTGVDLNHPAFKGHLDTASGWDYVGNDATPQDEPGTNPALSKGYGHGTAVADIILQVAPNATIVPYRVLGPNGGGDLASVILAINRATLKGVKVINLSLGSTTRSLALELAIISAIKSGVLVVASSGNSGDSNVTYPANSSFFVQLTASDGLICVGSITRDLLKSSFSTYGANLNLVAPGESVATAFPGGQRTLATGTSFAAPIVAGTAALAMSAGKTNPVALASILKNNAGWLSDMSYVGKMGNGNVNVGKALGAP